MTRVMVVGGAGVFGSRLVEGLAATTDLHVVVAGRDRERSEAAAAAVRARHPASLIEATTIDARSATAADLRATGATIVVDAAGPFQGVEPHLAKVAIAPRRDGMVSERFGPFTFDLELEAAVDGLTMRIVGWRLGRLPLPRCLAPNSEAVESTDAEGRFRFDVGIALPLAGRLARYRGWLVLQP